MPHPAKAKAKKSSTARHEAIQGYLFVTPYLIAFTIFTGIPFVSAFVLSFLDVKFITRLDDVHFVAFKNFIRFFSNKEALAALGRTGLYTLIYVPVIMILSFILAYLLNKGVFWAKGIRSMFFLPYVSNMVAVAVVFQLMLGPRGPIYLLQKFFGIEDPIIPLLNQKWALPVVVLIAVWKGIGLNFLTYLGALQNVDKSQVEAARIDGCSHFTIYRRIILPLCMPQVSTMLLFSFVWSWNDYMGPYLYISDINKQMISVGIKLFASGLAQDYGAQMAGATLVLIPVIVAFFLCQKYFVEGITAGAVKG